MATIDKVTAKSKLRVVKSEKINKVNTGKKRTAKREPEADPS